MIRFRFSLVGLMGAVFIVAVGFALLQSVLSAPIPISASIALLWPGMVGFVVHRRRFVFWSALNIVGWGYLFLAMKFPQHYQKLINHVLASLFGVDTRGMYFMEESATRVAHLNLRSYDAPALACHLLFMFLIVLAGGVLAQVCFGKRSQAEPDRGGMKP